MLPRTGLKRPDAGKLKTAFRAAAYIDVSKVAVPPVVDWASRVEYDNYQNDRFGNCGPAGCANMIRQWSSNVGNQISLPQSAVDRAYADVGEWNGRDSGSGTDQGVDPLKLLNYFRKVGIGGRKIRAYAIIDPQDEPLVDACLYLFGALAIGFDMPAQWQSTIGDTWRAPRNPAQMTGDWGRGSWGGHFVVGAKADQADWEVATWGKLQKVSGNGFRSYCMFLAVVFSDDWFSGANKRAPNGFDAELLARDLEHIEQGKPLEERPSEKEKPANGWRPLITRMASFAGAKVEQVSTTEDRLTW